MALFFVLASLTGILKLQAIPRFLIRFDIYLPTYLITEIHKWAGLLLAGSALAHLVLHWKWLVRTTRTVFQTNTAGNVEARATAAKRRIDECPIED
jgi:hypothetical protein